MKYLVERPAVIIVSLILMAGCTRTVLRTEKIPVHEMTKKKVGVKLEPITTVMDVDPALRLGTGRVAIIPFSNGSTRKSAGVSVSEEFEHWFISNKKKINEKAKRLFKNREDYFQIVSRTQLSRVMTEQELTEAGKVAANTATKLKNILSIEYILTGHVRNATENEWSAIFKAIKTETSEIAWSKKLVAGNLEDLIFKAGNLLLPHQETKVVGNKEIPVFENVKERVGYREREYEEQEPVPTRFFLRIAGAWLPYPISSALYPEFSLGMHWDAGTYDFRLMVLGGPTVVISDDGSVMFKVFLSGEFKIPIKAAGGLFALVDSGVGFGGVFEGSKDYIEFTSPTDPTVKARKKVDLKSGFNDFFFAGVGVGYSFWDGKLGLSTKVRVNVGQGQISELSECFDSHYSANVPCSEQSDVNIGVSWNFLEVSLAL